MRREALLPSVLVSVLVMLGARSAWATPSARLVYARSPEAASCPDEAALRGAVAARFGYDPFFAWARQTVVVEVLRSEHRYRSRIQIVDAQGMSQGSRELVSDEDSCATLFDTTALAISIALDAAAKLETAEAQPDGSASLPPTPSPELPPAPSMGAAVPPLAAEKPTAAPPGPWRGFAGVAVLGSSNVAPSLAAGFSGFGEVRWRDASLALEMRADAPASATDASSRARVTSWIYGAGLVPCAHYSLASLCAVGLLGSLQAWSSQVVTNRPERALFAAAGGRVGFELPLTDAFALRLQLDVLANLNPTGLRVDATTESSAHSYLLSVGAGIAVRFP